MVADTKLYDILDISPNANENEIKKAYRKLAVKHHPDKGGDSEKFKEISSAYETLSNSEKRQKYDNLGSDFENSMPDIDPMNIFKSFFGAHGSDPFFSSFGGERQDSSKSKQVELRISLEDLYNGKESKFKITRNNCCTNCKGIVSKCRNCNGTGQFVEIMQIGPGMVQQRMGPCGACHGKGKIVQSTSCTYCDGTQLVEETFEIKLNIKPGTHDGEKIMLRKHGDYDPNNQKYGDLIFILKQRKHSRLSRKGDDLFMEHTISLYEALIGCNINYAHLDSKFYTINCNKVIKPGELFCVPKMGMTFRGNLFIKMDVHFPTNTIADSNTKSLLFNLLNTPDIPKPKENSINVQMYPTDLPNNSHEEERPGQCHQQ
tara:strand:+ start:28674 stop:29795 length:1122 start_codon:yes stop_codon:yes gene_type:complete